MTSNRKGRALTVLVVAAAVSFVGGFVLASVVTITTTNETSTTSQVAGGNSVLINSGTAGSVSVNPSVVPLLVTTCSSGTVTIPSPAGVGGTVSAYVSSTTGSTTCTAGDYAQLFKIVTGSTAASGTYTTQVTTQWGSGPTLGENTVTFSLGTTLVSAATINLYVDYGTVLAPTGGITSIQVVIAP